MSKRIQVRDVPDALHRKLKARAAEEGVSLSDFILAEIGRAADRPTRRELLARLGQPVRGELRPSAAELVREQRQGR